ncbi:MAG: ATP-binding protein [bacterium]|nr:ATP-binding protein [bacterium]
MTENAMASIAPHETNRIQELERFNIMDSGTESEFDNLVTLAAQICEVPVAQINFIDDTRQWSKAKVGVEFTEIPREVGFCHHTIQQESFMIVENTLDDDRFNEMPFVKDAPGVRFYAGFNVRSNALNMGTICVIGLEPKQLQDHQKKALETLAKEVEARLELRRRNIELDTISRFLESSVDVMIVADANTFRIEKYTNQVAAVLENGSDRHGILSLYNLFTDVELLAKLKAWNYPNSNHTLNIETVLNDEDSKLRHVALNIHKHGDKFYLSGNDISHKKQYQASLERSLEEKNVLLAEIHHRVKNNLAVISSFLQLEEFKTENEAVQRSLFSNYMRVNTMALIHEQLYQESDFTAVIFDQYIHNLIKETREKRASKFSHISLNYTADYVLLNINQALPCALILNELIANAYEYAFFDRDSGNIHITLKQIDDEIRLSVEDDGIGLPKDFVFEQSPTLGATLMYSYSDQLNAEVDIQSENGSRFELRFKSQRDLKGSASSVSIAV